MEKGNHIFHKLDRYIGIPLVFTFGLFKKKKQLPKSIKKIAILNLGSIGDNVLMSASVLDVRKAYPDSQIIIFTGSTNFEIVKLIPNVNEVIKLKIGNILKSASAIRKMGTFDVLIDFGPWPRINAIYAFLSNAKYRIGFRTTNQYRHYVYDKIVEHSDEKHEIDNHRELIKALDIHIGNIPQLIVKEFDLSGFNIDPNHRIAILHPWSGGLRKLDKQWSNERWKSLYFNIHKDFDQVLITGAPSDFDDSQHLLEQIQEGKNSLNIINMTGKLSLSETIYLIKISDFVFCVDTGIAHIAAALDRPQICLQGPANSLRWRPYSEKAYVVNPSKGTYGYISLGFEKNPDDTHCMDNIYVESVLSTYHKYISEN
ncbi:MAG: lipopolysaccharide heptosyltransferase family protein [Chryseobacterium sp.]|nr:lipopolysaccharide heptosyltransferase family protein [Chryseobacterium sp.]